MFSFIALLSAALAIGTPAFAADSRMNPELSLNGLFEWAAGNRGNDPLAARKNGLAVKEVEMQLGSDIDPYLRGTANLSISQDPTGAWGIEPEEAFIESLSVPGMTLKGGKFFASFGKLNSVHRHAWPFIDAPLASQVLVGDEGYNDVGVSASLLLPLPFFAELTGQAFNPPTDSILFGSPTPEDWSGLGTLRTLWDLNDETTFELLGSYLAGRNATEDVTWLSNGSATLKWRKDESHALILAGEIVHREIDTMGSLDAEGGASGWLQWQFSRRWWVQGRGELLGLGEPVLPITRKYSALLALAPSEFSGWRLQYDRIETQANDPEHRLTLQLNVTMGVHPAHSY
jgi:hypothetical protein